MGAGGIDTKATEIYIRTAKEARSTGGTKMDRMTTAKARKLGWTVGRGAYTGTTDDRADRWYIRREDGGPIDRRGRGWPTRQAALDAIAEHVAMTEAQPR